MNKVDNLNEAVGGYIEASVGQRDEEPVVAIPIDENTASGEFQGRVRYKSAAVIELDRIMSDPDQPRKTFNQDEMEQLQHSIETKGLLTPIRVRWSAEHDKFVIIMGDRRYRACKAISRDTIECVVHEGELDDAERFELALIENCVREDLSPMETANAFATLKEKKNYSARQMAEELKMAVTTVTRALNLLKLPEWIQNLIDKGKVPPGVARELVKLDEEKQKAMVQEYLSGNLTSGQAATAARSKSSKKTPTSNVNKSFTTPDGLKIAVTGKSKRVTNARIAEALREFAEMLESDGRTKRSIQAAA